MTFRSILFTAATAILAAAWNATGQTADCPPTFSPVTMGTPMAMELDEISGLVASRQAPGVLWAVNDSGAPAIYAITETGILLGRYVLSGATLVDWEDIAIGPGPAGEANCLYVGDFGNNTLSRDVVRVYGVPEPPVDAAQSFIDTTLTEVATYDLAYPAGAHDCEALLVEPDTGDLYLLTKDSTGADGGYSYIYRNAAPLQPGATTALVEVARVFLGVGLIYYVTAADLAPDRSAVMLRTYGYAYYWPLMSGQTLESGLLNQPCVLPTVSETQTESIAFDANGQGFFTTSEWFKGSPQPIYYYELAPWEPEPDPTCGNTTGGLYQVGDRLCLRLPEALTPEAPYQWRRDGEALVSDGHISGALARSLVILPLTTNDTGAYTCTYTTGAKTTETFGPVYVTVATQVPVSSGGVLALCVLIVALLGAASLSKAPRRRRE